MSGLLLDKKASRILLDLARRSSGKVLYVKSTGSDAAGVDGKTLSTPKATIVAAVALAAEGDVLRLAEGGYDETVQIAEAKSKLTIEGVGNLGAAFIEPETAGAEGMLVLADDITLRNVGVAGDDAADYSLQVGNQSVSPRRFRAYDCKFEGAPVILKGVGDVLFEDCEFAWEGALQFAANDNGFCTQVTLRRCRFHNITTEHIKSLESGGVRNLILEDCTFDNAEDATPPTAYIKVDEAGDTGIITGCRFATATHAATVIDIAAGVMYAGNYAESGVSSARPA